ncbi:MAG TPA: TRAFs-binding domain-containing protein [Pyrinomonadaceae bacterium]|nr:TRAFs-binding domain-containing protein [Pyrinomonadaceae bacterium]
MDRPLCFVLMPFGLKKDPSGGPDIDFDLIYKEAIRPGIVDAEMEPIRADEERTGGIIHQAMFERLLLCDFAVADLTTANANVFYELGVRHAVRPATTLTIFSTAPPFDVNYLRSVGYKLGPNNSFGEAEAKALRDVIARRLGEVRKLAHEAAAADSPIFQLLKEYKAPDIAHLKTDAFLDRVESSKSLKRDLAEAREGGDLQALNEIEKKLGALDGIEAGVSIDLYLSYRAVSAWDNMIELFNRLPLPLKRNVMVREQYAFALNRKKKRQEAVQILEEICNEQGPGSETNGLMGRVYKDLWVEAKAKGDVVRANGYLRKALDSYVRGFEADWRDAYPGINAVTLLDIKGDAQSLKLKSELLPVVRFAVLQRLKTGTPDYWDHATLLELEVLDSHPDEAAQHLSDALVTVRARWEPETTENNLKLIQEARRSRKIDEPWLEEIISQLHLAATPPSADL